MEQRNSLMYERFETLGNSDRQIPMIKFSFTDIQPQSLSKPEAAQKRTEPTSLMMGNPFSSKDSEVCRPTQRLFNPNDTQKPNANPERAQQWKADASKQAKQPVKPDAQGRYEVQKGDSLWGITKRLLDSEGQKKPTPEQFNNKLKELVELNKDRYPGLDCNPGLVKPGMKLTMKPAEAAQPKVELQKPKAELHDTSNSGDTKNSGETYNLSSEVPSSLSSDKSQGEPQEQNTHGSIKNYTKEFLEKRVAQMTVMNQRFQIPLENDGFHITPEQKKSDTSETKVDSTEPKDLTKEQLKFLY